MTEPNLKELMRMAQEMQHKMKETHENLSSQIFVGVAGGDLVQIEMTGDHVIKGVNIKPEALKEGPEFLADLIKASLNDVIRKIKTTSEQKMSALSKQLGLPNSRPTDE